MLEILSRYVLVKAKPGTSALYSHQGCLRGVSTPSTKQNSRRD